MCTVTIIPKGENDFVLTSNRDEAPNRVTLPPKVYKINKTKMLFPKDEKAGGTWIGVSEQNRLLCLLNGGFEFHQRKATYRISRGVVVTDLLKVTDIQDAVEAYNLFNVEPFTLVIADWNSNLRFYELIWDGVTKFFTELPKEARIWSSSTLYTQEMRAERKEWFNLFKSEYDLTSDNALQFHKHTHIDNKEYGVVMDREFVKTTSISQIDKTNNEVVFKFENLQNNTKLSTSFLFPETIHE